MISRLTLRAATLAHLRVASVAIVAAVAVSSGLGCSRPPSPAQDADRAPAAPPTLPPITATELTRATALRGELPEGPEVNLLASRCAICHTTQYVTAQRLTTAQWEKTLVKMRKWGAPLEDADVPRLALYLSTHFSPELPDLPPRPAAPPQGALP